MITRLFPIRPYFSGSSSPTTTPQSDPPLPLGLPVDTLALLLSHAKNYDPRVFLPDLSGKREKGTKIYLMLDDQNDPNDPPDLPQTYRFYMDSSGRDNNNLKLSQAEAVLDEQGLLKNIWFVNYPEHPAMYNLAPIQKRRPQTGYMRLLRQMAAPTLTAKSSQQFFNHLLKNFELDPEGITRYELTVNKDQTHICLVFPTKIDEPLKILLKKHPTLPDATLVIQGERLHKVLIGEEQATPLTDARQFKAYFRWLEENLFPELVQRLKGIPPIQKSSQPITQAPLDITV